MEFRLTYKGKLPSATAGNTRAKHKHQIRKQLHRQLSVLWQRHPLLNDSLQRETEGRKNVQFLADRFRHCDHRFVPLIREEHHHSCSIDVLFLRRDSPGNLVNSGGDIDNRLKVLFDALTFPRECSGVDPPEDDENPFFCVLEDDKLITDIRVTTDRLLSPLEPEESENDVFLVIHVTTTALNYQGLFTGL